MADLMKGKRGLVMGVANDHSIAWGVARTLAAEGATLGFSYQGESFGRRVTPLAESVGSDFLVNVDVTDGASMDEAFERIESEWGTRFPRPCDRLLRQERAHGPLRRHQPR